jgi:hypothetical protein
MAFRISPRFFEWVLVSTFGYQLYKIFFKELSKLTFCGSLVCLFPFGCRFINLPITGVRAKTLF